jgi:hypothetical protein
MTLNGFEPEHWLVRPTTIKLLWGAFLIVLASLVALDLVVTHHTRFDFEGTFAFAAWFGFFACVALIVLAKALGALLKRPDDYYDS